MYFEVVIAVFMLLFGVNFNLYYLLLCRKFREAFHSEELLAYFGIVFAAVAAITVNLFTTLYNFGDSLRHAFFQVASIITTTGFATVDFDLWPTFSKTVLVILMFFGACAGSTGGGLKISRILILCKTAVQDVRHMVHPHAVSSVRFEHKPLDEKTYRSTHVYFVLFTLLFGLSILLLSLDHFDTTTTVTAVAACFNNIGPGLSVVGPMGNYALFSPASKLLLSLDMLLGRLEIYPIIVLFVPTVWASRHKRRR